MEWYNMFLNIDFICGDWLNILKELSFISAISILVILLFALIVSGMKKSTVRNIVTLIAIILFSICSLLVIFLAISLIVYPVQYIASILKQFIINKYNLIYLSFTKDIILNLFVLFISCSLWIGSLGALVKKSLE